MSSHLQFGYKSKVSTTMCTSTLLSVIEHYNKNNSTVYLLKLDASSAFDRVEYVKLFRLLLLIRRFKY